MITIRDGAGTERQVKSTDSADGHATHHRIDASVLPVGASTEATLASCLTQLQTTVSTLTSMLATVNALPSASVAASEATLLLAKNLVGDVKTAVLAQATKLEAQPVSISSSGHALDSSLAAILAQLQVSVKTIGGVSANAAAGVTSDITTTSDTLLVAAVSAKRTYVRRLTISNSGGTAAFFNIKDGTTVIWSVYIAAGQTMTFDFDKETAPVTTVNTALNVAATATTSYRVSWGVTTE